VSIYHDNVDSTEMLRAAIQNKRILKDRPGPSGYTDGSPVKATDEAFGATVGFAGERLGLGLDGEFGRYASDPVNQQRITEYANLFYNSPINSDIIPPPVNEPAPDQGGLA
jgi:hypothetical protein